MCYIGVRYQELQNALIFVVICILECFCSYHTDTTLVLVINLSMYELFDLLRKTYIIITVKQQQAFYALIAAVSVCGVFQHAFMPSQLMSFCLNLVH